MFIFISFIVVLVSELRFLGVFYLSSIIHLVRLLNFVILDFLCWFALIYVLFYRSFSWFFMLSCFALLLLISICIFDLVIVTPIREFWFLAAFYLKFWAHLLRVCIFVNDDFTRWLVLFIEGSQILVWDSFIAKRYLYMGWNCLTNTIICICAPCFEVVSPRDGLSQE